MKARLSNREPRTENREPCIRWFSVLGSWFCIIFLIACQSTNNGAQRVGGSGPTAFEVAGHAITVAEVQQRVTTELGGGVQQLLSQGQSRDQIIALAKQQNVLKTLFDQFIQEELLGYEARRQGIGIDPKLVDTQLGQAQSQSQNALGNDPAQILSQRIHTARQQMTFTVIAHQVRADQFKSRHILVQTEAEANAIMDRLKKGESFEQLAREQSQDTNSAPKGGELGWIARGNLPELDQVAFDEKTSLNTPVVVRSQSGYHVLEVEGRELNRPFDSFDQLRQNQNAQQLFNDQFLPWYTQYRKDAEQKGLLKVVIDPNSLDLPFPAGTP